MLKKQSKKKKAKAFTLPELLIVITIIFLLVGVVYISMQPNKSKSRDAKRVAEINSIRTALQMYYMDHGKYPKSTPQEEWCSIEGEVAGRPQCHDGSFYNKIRPYLAEIPGDPLFPTTEEGKIYSYQYRSTSSGDGYILHTDLETGESYEVASLLGKEIAYFPPWGGGDFSEYIPGISGAIMSLSAADLDYDGDIDLIGGQGYGTDATEWYENDGNQSFTTHKLDGNQVCGVYTADVNQDGFIDILSADRHESLRWFESDGSGNFNTHLVSDSIGDSWTIYTNDVDGDGDMDIVSGTYDGEVWWFENDGSETFQKHVIDSHGVHSVSAEDMDNDGDIDIVSADYWGNKLRWYENDGSENFSLHNIADITRAYRLYVKDIDSDGDKDIVVSEYDGWNTNNGKVWWFENDGSGSFTGHTVATNLNAPEGVFAIDLDNDSDIDIVSVSFCTNYEINWYENDGSENFSKHTIQANVGAPVSVHSKDLDLDGAPDVIVGFYINRGIRWYKNNF